MSNNEITEKVVTGDLGKAVKPPAMTPIATGGENRGIKPVPMTQTPSQAPAQPASGNTTPTHPAQSPKK